MTASCLFKLAHFLNRTFRQGSRKTGLSGKITADGFFSRFKHIPDLDHRYNPLFAVIERLDPHGASQAFAACPAASAKSSRPLGKNRGETAKRQRGRYPERITRPSPGPLPSRYPHIRDYRLRLPPPAAPASCERFARNGHRVFYVNAISPRNIRSGNCLRTSGRWFFRTRTRPPYI